jgi:hypothetical protein
MASRSVTFSFLFFFYCYLLMLTNFALYFYSVLLNIIISRGFHLSCSLQKKRIRQVDQLCSNEAKNSCRVILRWYEKRYYIDQLCWFNLLHLKWDVETVHAYTLYMFNAFLNLSLITSFFSQSMKLISQHLELILQLCIGYCIEKTQLV